MSEVAHLFREDLRARSAYAAAVPRRDLIRLHANENPWSLNDPAGSDPGTDAQELNRYPDPRPQALVAAMADFYAVASAAVLPVRGSDDGIDLLLRAFCTAGVDSITISNPTFSMYASFAGVQNAAVVDVPLISDAPADTLSEPASASPGDASWAVPQRWLRVDIDAIAAVSPASKLVFVCSPNNPTGQVVSRASISSLCERLSRRSMVVVDEAYIEFCDQGSVSDLLSRFDNLIILRTLSKAFGAAGIRCGAVLAHPDVIRYLQSLTTPYALPTPCIEQAIRAFAPAQLAVMASRITQLRQQCARMQQQLANHPALQSLYPSHSNFCLVQCQHADRVAERLLDAGVLVRNFSRYPRLQGCLRISAGSSEQTDAVLAVMQQLAQDGVNEPSPDPELVNNSESLS